jgi:hypothetical protein
MEQDEILSKPYSLWSSCTGSAGHQTNSSGAFNTLVLWHLISKAGLSVFRCWLSFPTADLCYEILRFSTRIRTDDEQDFFIAVTTTLHDLQSESRCF